MLADDLNRNTDHREDDEGNVEVEVQGKWRLRKSYLEKRDSFVNIVGHEGASSSGLATGRSAEAFGDQHRRLGDYAGV